jgi:hypothetical protein
VKRRIFKNYPRGSSVAGTTPGHQAPIVAVDADWIAAFGSRAQRRRVARAQRKAGR